MMAGVFCALVGLGIGAAAPELNQTTFARWRDYILPAPDELHWREIPWRTSFGQAVSEAHERDKPILLWAMNGHPLGCT